jgi:hypothetical protein
MVKKKPLFAQGSWFKKYHKTLYLYEFPGTLIFVFFLWGGATLLSCRLE